MSPSLSITRVVLLWQLHSCFLFSIYLQIHRGETYLARMGSSCSHGLQASPGATDSDDNKPYREMSETKLSSSHRMIQEHSWASWVFCIRGGIRHFQGNGIVYHHRPHKGYAVPHHSGRTKRTQRAAVPATHRTQAARTSTQALPHLPSLQPPQSLMLSASRCPLCLHFPMLCRPLPPTQRCYPRETGRFHARTTHTSAPIPPGPRPPLFPTVLAAASVARQRAEGPGAEAFQRCECERASQPSARQQSGVKGGGETRQAESYSKGRDRRGRNRDGTAKGRGQASREDRRQVVGRAKGA